MNVLRYGVREQERWGYIRFYVRDNDSGLDVTGARLSRESAQGEADRLNGELLRLEVQQRASA